MHIFSMSVTFVCYFRRWDIATGKMVHVLQRPSLCALLRILLPRAFS